MTTLVAGMVAGAYSIDDMAILRHGGTGRLFASYYAPSTLGRSCAPLPSATYPSSTRWLPGLWLPWRAGPRGAAQLVAEALAPLKRVPDANTGKVLLRTDSAFYGYATVQATAKAGAAVSHGPHGPAIRGAITGNNDNAWKLIQYTDAVFDEAAERWISCAEVAETEFTAFTSRKKAERVAGRLVVRRIPDRNPHEG